MLDEKARLDLVPGANSIRVKTATVQRGDPLKVELEINRIYFK